MIEKRVANAIRKIPNFPKKGVEFQDISPIFLDVALVNEMVEAFADAGREMHVSAVVGIESRGYLMGPMIAQRLGVPFVMVRKRGGLPGNSVAHINSDLEYGSSNVEMNTSDLPEHARVMIHDDLLATGITAAASAKMVHSAGCEVAMFAFIGHLTYLDGADMLMSYSPDIFTLAEID
jgi:adenine phosphoribosyltransferase